MMLSCFQLSSFQLFEYLSFDILLQHEENPLMTRVGFFCSKMELEFSDFRWRLHSVLRKIYSEEWMFFRTTLLRTFMVLLIVSTVTAWISYHYFRQRPEKTRAKLVELQEYYHTHSMHDGIRISRCTNIFLNNFVVSLNTSISGFIPFLCLPTITVILSGSDVGLIFASNELVGLQDIFKGSQDKFTLIFKRLLPHGILEFTAVLYASSIGVFLSLQMSRRLLPTYKRSGLPIRNVCIQVARSFFLVVTPLLLVAAVIQTFLTPK